MENVLCFVKMFAKQNIQNTVNMARSIINNRTVKNNEEHQIPWNEKLKGIFW